VRNNEALKPTKEQMDENNEFAACGKETKASHNIILPDNDRSTDIAFRSASMSCRKTEGEPFVDIWKLHCAAAGTTVDPEF